MRSHPRAPTRGVLLLLIALAGAFAAVFGYIGRQHDLKTRVPEVIALLLLGGAVYIAGVYLVENFSFGPGALAVILGSGVLVRLTVLPLDPFLSEDVYRYEWEGRVQRANLNPYAVYPAMPGLAWLKDPKHPIETGTTTPTVYPPLSEIAFSLVETVRGYKRLFTALDLAALGLLLLLLWLMKQPLERILIYAWNPAVVVAFALCGHHDALAVATLLTAYVFIIGDRAVLSIFSLALSFLAKFFPGLLFPVFLKRTRWSYGAIFLAVVGLVYLPYLGAGSSLFKGLSDFAKGWEANDSLFRLIRLAGNSRGQASLVTGVMLLALLAYVLKKNVAPLRAGLLLTAAALLLSPIAFPWYFTWTVPFLCFYPSRAWLLMTVLSVLGYAPVVAFAAGQPFEHSPWILGLEYGPVLVWLIHDGWRWGKGERARP